MKRKFAPWGRGLPKKKNQTGMLFRNFEKNTYYHMTGTAPCPIFLENHTLTISMPIFSYFWALSDWPKKTRGLSCLQPFNDIAIANQCVIERLQARTATSARGVLLPPVASHLPHLHTRITSSFVMIVNIPAFNIRQCTCNVLLLCYRFTWRNTW